MARAIYRINEFLGIDQSSDENALKSGMSPDACNMDTSDGGLKVCRGMKRAIEQPIPGTGKIHAVRAFRTIEGTIFVAAAGESIYAYKNGEWQEIYAFSSPLESHRFDFAQADINSKDYLIIATGEGQMLKFDGESVSLFGSAEGNSNISANYLALYKSRLFAAGDKEHPNRLYWSELPGGTRSIESWASVEASANVEGGHTEVGSMKSDPIVALSALGNQLIIFKRDSVFRLLGDKPSNFIIEQVEGCTERANYRAIVKRAGSLFFLTRGGIAVFNGVNAALMSDAKRISKILDNSSVSESRGAICSDKLYFTLDEAGGEANALIEYDISRGIYMLRRGFRAYDICSVDGKVYIANENRRLCALDEGNTYDGADINAYWQTPVSDLYDKGSIKCMRRLYLRGRSDERDSATLIDVRIGENESTYRTLLPKSETEVLEVPLKNEGRTFSLRLYNEAGGSFELMGGIEAEFETRRRTE